MKRRISVLLALLVLFSAVLPVLSASGEEFETVSPAALLMDAQSGAILYEKAGHDKRSCASITKVMTLLLVFEAIDDGRLSMDQSLSASSHAASMGGSDIWLEAGETMTVDDLIKATVIMSANDAAVVLAEGVSGSEESFVQLMNQRAAELGMNDTVFKNCNGLDEEGHLTSAYDVALMSRGLIQHEGIFTYTNIWIDYLRDGKTQLVNTNKLIKSYEGITGLKTGTTSQAGSCITATAQRGDMGLIAVVLGAGSTNDRFKDAAALLDYGFANWTVTVPDAPWIESIEIKGGMEKAVETEPLTAPSILLRASDQAAIESRIEIWDNLEAPVDKGEILGKAVYFAGDSILAETDIVAAHAVEKITFKTSFFYVLSEMIRFS